MTDSSALIDMQNITKVYQMGETKVLALDSVSLSIDQGEYVAIVGTSGSGKSTLMNIIGLLDRPTDGVFQIRGHRAGDLTGRQLADLRNKEIGLVFQRFNLLARAPAWWQVELPLFYANVARSAARQRALEALAQVGLAERAGHKPEEFSGGQQQRVAVARALVNGPSLLLADEPTGALDTRTGEEVMALFEELNQEGLTLVIVTHPGDRRAGPPRNYNARRRDHLRFARQGGCCCGGRTQRAKRTRACAAAAACHDRASRGEDL